MKYSQKTYEGALASLAELREQSTSDSERTTIDFIAEAVAEKADRDVLGLEPQTCEQLQAAAPRWISVNEALPESPFTVVLAIVYASNGHLTFNGACQLVTYDPTDGWYLDDYPAEFERITVTHWMPLPEPPEEVVVDAKPE
ncbi:DUF551 domain-containing protein [Agathobaculum sp. Marseille-P7918]|uniref:DUF551 domain-containing protein n=1 Tax=Agathobaculum sp. Marseille-P7918 TaxID=2479843 RepID=UPI000F636DD2|nr:DUF551 domain-containing protein [Agathobaculum sp. Marseille-P7918]